MRLRLSPQHLRPRCRVEDCDVTPTKSMPTWPWTISTVDKEIQRGFLCPRCRARIATPVVFTRHPPSQRFYALVVGRVLRRLDASDQPGSDHGWFLCPRCRACIATHRERGLSSSPHTGGFDALVVGRVLRRLTESRPPDLRIHSRLRALGPRVHISLPLHSCQGAYLACDLHASAARHLTHHRTARTHEHPGTPTPAIFSQDIGKQMIARGPATTTAPTDRLHSAMSASHDHSTARPDTRSTDLGQIADEPISDAPRRKTRSAAPRWINQPSPAPY